MSASQSRLIHIAAASDENYAMPLAVTVRSLLSTLSHGTSVRLYIIDGGISPDSKDRLARSWRDPRLTVDWLEPDLGRIDGFPVSNHVTRTAYARILLPFLLPETLDRVIYLDSDLLIRRDVSPLWDEPFQGAAALAIADVAAPKIDAELSLDNFQDCRPLLGAARPVPNYRELGLSPHAPYFNSGVLCIDLDVWRRDKIAEQALDCLDRYREHVLWWDQYALNVVLHGRWRPIDCRWNQGSHIYRYPAPIGPFTAGENDALRRDPWIVHFTSGHKPWQWESTHPFKRQFLRTVDQTAWKGWRPEAPYHNMAEWIGYHLDRYRDWTKKNERKRKKLRKEAKRRKAA